MAFSLGKLILLLIMYMNCATGKRKGEGEGGEKERERQGKRKSVLLQSMHSSNIPLRSAGTRNFFLSISGIVDLGTLSTITYIVYSHNNTRSQELQIKVRTYWNSVLIFPSNFSRFGTSNLWKKRGKN